VVELRSISKSFDKKAVVNEVNLEIGDGEFLTLLGPSGCGKTTILRMIGGFLKPDKGEIILHGENVADVPANKREVSTVFQSYALFPHLNVRGNVGFGLRMKKIPKKEIEERVDEILELTNLTPYSNRKPAQLSGGQQQRVAIARSLVTKPKVMLFDEPLGALDLKLRRQMQLELKRMQKAQGITYVYVTHDQEEALTMSDRIVVMKSGKIEQSGSPEEVYLYPKTQFVAEFLGDSNLFTGSYTESDTGAFFETEGLKIPIPRQEKKPDYISIRPEFFRLHGTDKQKPGGICFSGLVEKALFLGNVFRYDVRLASKKLVQVFAEDANYMANMEVYISCDTVNINTIGGRI
jgi:spermidine/putrescine transport system ATP-binding protein